MNNTSKGRVIALGFFDGVHVGHAALLQKTVQVAAQKGVHSCALTFDTHPEALITGSNIPLLNTVNERAEMMRSLYGVEEVIFAHFDDSLMHLSWRDFLHEMLMERFEAVHLVAGHDFHFGFRGEGNTQNLAEECMNMGIGCDVIPKVEIDSITVSSTYIRKLIAQGDMERATLFLGHPHLITGHVAHGQSLGTSIEVPTSNLRLDPMIQTPAHGVYVTITTLDGVRYQSITNIGTRPTVDGKGITVETHILDFMDDIYGQEIKVEFLKMLRCEQKFLNINELRGQIKSDIKQVRDYFARSPEQFGLTNIVG